MGYRSCGTGIFSLRDGKNREEALKAVREEGFEITRSACDNTDNKYLITFVSWKMCYSGESMKKVMEFFNGEFQVEGEEPQDVWKLSFKDGKAFVTPSEIIFKKPEEIDLDSYEWNLE